MIFLADFNSVTSTNKMLLLGMNFKANKLSILLTHPFLSIRPTSFTIAVISKIWLSSSRPLKNWEITIPMSQPKNQLEGATTTLPNTMPSRVLYNLLRLQKTGISMYCLTSIIEESGKVYLPKVTASNKSANCLIDALSGTKDIHLILGSRESHLNCLPLMKKYLHWKEIINLKLSRLLISWGKIILTCLTSYAFRGKTVSSTNKSILVTKITRKVCKVSEKVVYSKENIWLTEVIVKLVEKWLKLISEITELCLVMS